MCLACVVGLLFVLVAVAVAVAVEEKFVAVAGANSIADFGFTGVVARLQL